MSGAPIGAFVGIDKHPKHYGLKLAEHLGCDPEDSIENILKHLQGLEAGKFQNCLYFFEEFMGGPMPFKPIVDGGLVKDPILPQEPLILLKKGDFNKVPLMIGTGQSEGLIIKGLYDKNPKKYDEAFDNWEVIGPLGFFHREKDEFTKEESEICLNYITKYFGSKRFSGKGEVSESLVNMMGDALFTAPVDITTKMITAHKDAPPVYQYVYNHQGRVSFYELISFPIWKLAVKFTSLAFGFDLFKSCAGVCHGDELFMMFKMNILPFSLLKSEDDKKVSENLINMWTDFATYHNPTPKDNNWNKFDPKDPKYLEIGSKSNTMKYPESRRERMEEWREIWERIPPTMRYEASSTWKKQTSANTPEGVKKKENHWTDQFPTCVGPRTSRGVQ